MSTTASKSSSTRRSQPAPPPTTASSSPSPSDPTLERSFRGHTSPVLSLAFHPGLTSLASAGGNDQSVLVWQFKPQLRPLKLTGHRGSVLSVAYNHTGSALLSSSTDNTIRCWQPSATGRHSALRAHSAPVRHVSFSPTGDLFLSASDDKTCKLFTAASLRFAASLVGHTNWVRWAEFAPDERLIASASDDRTVRLWDTNTHSHVHTFHHSHPLHCTSFHPFGSVVAAAAADGSLKVWDVRSHSLLQHYRAHESALTALSWHPSGNSLLSAGADGSLKLWDVRAGQQLYTIHGHEGAVRSAVFSSDGQWFASGGDDCRVMVWKSNIDQQQQQRQESHDEQKERMTADSSRARPSGGQRETALHDSFMTASNLSSQQHSIPAPLSTADLSSHMPPSNASSQPTHIRPIRSGKPPPPTIAQPEPHPSINLSYDCNLEHVHPASSASSTAPHPARSPPSSLFPTQPTASPSGSSGVGVSLPSDVSTALQQIVSQLDVITKTLSLFDQRLRQHEEKVLRIEQRQRDITRAGISADIEREMDALHSRSEAPLAAEAAPSFAASESFITDMNAVRTARSPSAHLTPPVPQ